MLTCLRIQTAISQCMQTLCENLLPILNKDSTQYRYSNIVVTTRKFVVQFALWIHPCVDFLTYKYPHPIALQTIKQVVLTTIEHHY